MKIQINLEKRPLYTLIAVLLLLLGIVYVSAFPSGTIPIPGHSGSELANGSVNTTQIADNAITSAELANDTGSAYKISGGLFNISSNNLGIGTTTHTYKLEIVNGTGGRALNVSNVLIINGTSGTVGINTTNPYYLLDIARIGTTGRALNVSDVLYVNSSSANVGIGTTAPQTKLEVVGTINASALQVGQVNVCLSDGTSCIAISGGNGSAWNRTGSFVILAVTTDTVGIGTTAPNASLTVIGEINGTGLNISRNALVMGNVGIGTLNPLQALTVVGDANITGIAYIGTLNISGVTFTQGKIQATTEDAFNNTIANILNIEHTVTNRGQDGIGAGILFRAEENNTLTVNASMIAGLLTNATNTSVAGALTFYTRTAGEALIERMRIDGFGNIGIGTTTHAYKLEIVNGTGGKALNVSNILFVNGTSANVGIGTSSPSSSLTVIGEINGTSLKISNNALIIGNLSVGTSGTASTYTLQVENGSGGGALNVSNIFFVNGTSGNVGIGIMPPTNRFHIKSASTNSNPFYVLASDESELFKVQETSLGTGLIYIGDADGTTKVLLHSAGSSYFTGGNVGIGTATPAQTLTVVGSANISGDAVYLGKGNGSSPVLFVNGTRNKVGIMTDHPADVTLNINATNATGGEGGNMRDALLITNTTGSPLLYINASSGRVGIGTTAPQTKLEVVGTINASALQVGQVNVCLSDGTNCVDIPGGNSSAWNRTGSFVILAVTPDTVGIGTTAPNASLTVIGEINGTGLNISKNAVVMGNVGIGTINPLQTLTVVGSANISGDAVYLGKGNGSSPVLFVNGTRNKVGIMTDHPADVTLNINATNATGGEGGNMRDALLITNTTGSPLLYINASSGYVGIGTANPTAFLSLYGSTVDNQVISPATSDGADNRRLAITGGGSTGVSRGAEISLYGNEYTGKTGNIEIIGGVGGDIQFWIAPTATTSGQRMIITSAGRVGIGTATPAQNLTIVGNVNITGTPEAGFAFVVNNTFFINGSTGNVGIGTTTPTSMLQVTGNATFATTSGNVGIGTASPNAKLTVIGEINGTGLNISKTAVIKEALGIGTDFPLATLHVNGSGGGSGGLIVTNSTGRVIFLVNATSGTVNIGTTNGSYLLTIGDDALAGRSLNVSNVLFVNGSSGNVGIGLTNPGAPPKLYVSRTSGSSGDRAANIYNTATSGIQYGADIEAYGAATTNIALFLSATSATNNYGLIVQSGNVGIGNSSPPAPLTVSGNIIIGGANGIIRTDAASPFQSTGVQLIATPGTPYIVARLGTSDGSSGFAIYDSLGIEQFQVTSDGVTTMTGTCGDVGTGTCATDIAERISAPKDEPLEPGDVLVINTEGEEQITKSTAPYDTKVAGIFTSIPGIYMGSEQGLKLGGWNFTNMIGTMHNGTVPMALAGQVLVKATAENGPIEKGDLLTTSSTPGHTMKFKLLEFTGQESPQELADKLNENERRRNSILGKALEPLGSGTGKITALVTLQ